MAEIEEEEGVVDIEGITKTMTITDHPDSGGIGMRNMKGQEGRGEREEEDREGEERGEEGMIIAIIEIIGIREIIGIIIGTIGNIEGRIDPELQEDKEGVELSPKQHF